MGAVPKQLNPWRPGQSGNPYGRPKLPPELRLIKSLSQHEVCRYISKYARMPKDQLLLACADTKLPMIESCIASLFSKCTEKGDWGCLAFLLDRSVGKVPVIVEDEEDIAAREEIAQLSDQELFRLIAEKLPQYTTVKQVE